MDNLVRESQVRMDEVWELHGQTLQTFTRLQTLSSNRQQEEIQRYGFAHLNDRQFDLLYGREGLKGN